MRTAFLLLVLFLLSARTLSSQTVPEDSGNSRPPAYVSTIRFSGNKAISSDELRKVMGTTESRSFWGLGLFGGSRKEFDNEEFDRDIALLKKLYAFKGYFRSRIDYRLIPKNRGTKLDLDIRIADNEPARIDSLTYHGLDSVPPELRQQFLARQRIRLNDIFSVEQLIDERDRSLTFFREYGYAFFNEDSIRIKVDTVATRAGITFNLHLPKRLRYGPINAVLQNPNKSGTVQSVSTFAVNSINCKIYGDQYITPELLSSSIEFRPGSFTNQSQEQQTIQNFGATNIFSSVMIAPDSVKDGKLYTSIKLETLEKHQIEPKVLVDNRYGPIFFGTSLAYENKNLLGGAEQLRIATEYGSQLTSDSRLLANLDPAQFTKTIPYEFNLKSSLLVPVLNKRQSYYSGTIEYAAARQPVLLSSKTGLVRATYNTRLSPSARLNFDFFELEWVNKDSLRGFRQLFITDLASNIRVDPNDDARVNAAIDSLMSTHVNQTFRLRFNVSNRQNPLVMANEKTNWNLDLLLEESGSIPWFIDTYFDTRSYPGFTGKDPQVFGTTYSQYIKFESALSMTRNLSAHSQFAAKGRFGWMKPYGKAETTPEERRFYAGGANSMRGWLYNTLGPGNSTSKAASNFGADIKLEMNLEYRLKFFSFLNQPSGITFFADAGNIWDRSGPYALTLSSLGRDLALDAGVGLRLGSPIGPFRFDFAYRLRDPAEFSQWRLSELNLANCTFSFGIGEAF